MVEHITELSRGASRAIVTPVGGDPTVCRLDLFAPDALLPVYSFWWDPDDSLIHEGPAGVDQGPSVSATVERFQFVASDSLIELTGVQLRSAEGARIQLDTRIALYNRKQP